MSRFLLDRILSYKFRSYSLVFPQLATTEPKKSLTLQLSQFSGAETRPREISSDRHRTCTSVQQAMVWKRRNSGGAGGSPGRSGGADEEEEKVPRGHVPMVAGGERVLVPVMLLGDPRVSELLDMAAQRYGYGQPGVLRVPCDAGRFRRVVDGAMQRCGISSPA